jgi:hypothetical protein
LCFKTAEIVPIVSMETFEVQRLNFHTHIWAAAHTTYPPGS